MTDKKNLFPEEQELLNFFEAGQKGGGAVDTVPAPAPIPEPTPQPVPQEVAPKVAPIPEAPVPSVPTSGDPVLDQMLQQDTTRQEYVGVDAYDTDIETSMLDQAKENFVANQRLGSMFASRIRGVAGTAAKDFFLNEKDSLKGFMAESIGDFLEPSVTDTLPDGTEVTTAKPIGWAIQKLNPKLHEHLDKFFEHEERMADKAIADREAETGKKLQKGGLFDEAIYSAVHSPLQTGEGLALLFATKGRFKAPLTSAMKTNIVLAPAVAKEYYRSKTEAEEAGKSELQSFSYALTNAGAEYAFEVGPMNVLFKDGSFLTKLWKNMALEMGGEQATTFVQTLNRHAQLNPEWSWDDFRRDWGHGAAVTAIATPISSGVQTLVIDGVPKAVKKADELFNGKWTTEEIVDQQALEEKILESKISTGYDVAENNLKDVLRQVAEVDTQIEKIAGEHIPREEVGVQKPFEKPLRPEKLNLSYTSLTLPEYSETAGLTFVDQYGGEQSYIVHRPQAGQVVVSTPTDYSAESAFKRQQELVDRFKDEVKQGFREKEELVQPLKDLKEAKQYTQTEKAVAERLKEKVQPLVDKFFKGETKKPSVLVTMGAIDAKGSQNNLGSTYKFPARSRHGVDEYLISLNPRSMTDRSRATSVFFHEFGHAFHDNMYSNLPPNIRENVDTFFTKMQQEYLDRPLEDFMKAAMAPHRFVSWKSNFVSEYIGSQGDLTLRDTLKTLSTDLTMMGVEAREQLQYLLSPQEFFAEQTIKAAVGGALREDAKSIYSPYAKNLKVFAHTMSAEFGQDLGETIKPVPIVNMLYQRADLMGQKATWVRRKWKARKRHQAAQKEIMENPPTITAGTRVGGIFDKYIENPKVKERAKKGVDTFNWFISKVYGLQHLKELNKHIPQMVEYSDTVVDMQTEKMKVQNEANEILTSWQALLTEREIVELDRLLFEVDRESDAQGRLLGEEEIIALGQEKGITVTDNMLTVANRVWGSFRKAIQSMEDAYMEKLAETYEHDPIEKLEQQTQARKNFAALKNRNFMPHMRSGKYGVGIRALGKVEVDGKTYSRDQLIEFTLHHNEKAQQVQLENFLKRNPELRGKVEGYHNVLTEREIAYYGLPPALMDLLEVDTDLTEQQKAHLRQYALEHSAPASFAKHLQQRKNVEGYSQDGMKAYGEYFVKFSNHLSRAKYAGKLTKILEDFRADNANRKNANKRGELVNWLEHHREYIMNPGNELALLRAAGFVLYLGYVPKSAFVNLTQMPLVTYPYLASRYSDTDAIAALTTAMRDVGKFWKEDNQEK